MTSPLTTSASFSTRSMRHPSPALNERCGHCEPEAAIDADHHGGERDGPLGNEWVVGRRLIRHETCCPAAVRPPRSRPTAALQAVPTIVRPLPEMRRAGATKRTPCRRRSPFAPLESMTPQPPHGDHELTK